MVAFDNPYRVLGVDPNAVPEVIEAAYRTLMNKYHPDKKDGDEEKAKRITEAHRLLTHPDEFARYQAQQASRTEIGNYRILRKLAEGGFGTTYLGEHTVLGEQVCIKHPSKMSPIHRQIFMEEAKNVWDLRHYALPVMRDLIQLDDGSLALVMSFIPGLNIEEVINKRGKPLEAEHVAWIADRMLNVLRYIHLHGVVHGDVKPQNIIVQPESHTLVLVDFGLSLRKPTEATKAKGWTPIFAPPEELLGMPLLPESDFYSLGMTLIYALTGDENRTERKQIPVTVPEPFAEFISRLVRHDIFNRPDGRSENLCNTITRVREESFGRDRSGMLQITGI